jgi:putative DNA primase/helicase
MAHNNANGVRGQSTSTNGPVRFINGERCPICGGEDDDARGTGTRCFGYASRGWAHCTREEFAGRAEFNASSLTYGHRLKGDCPCGVEHSPAESKPKKEIERVYRYCDENDVPRHETVRYRPKGFKQRRSVNGEYVWSLQGIDTFLYRLPELLKADPLETVYLCEGEKDVENLRLRGRIATCNPMGAGKWKESYSEWLKARHVVMLPHNDQAGIDHANKVAQSLQGKAASVKLVQLPDLAEHGDVSDFLAAGGTVEQIDELAKATLEWTSPVKGKTTLSGDKTSDQDDDQDDEEHVGEPEDFHRTDLGNAKRLVADFGDRIRYCYPWKTWLMWDGKRWRKNQNGTIFHFAKMTIARFGSLAFKIADKKKRKAILRWAIESEKRKNIDSMVVLAQSEPGIAVLPEEFDQDGWLFNVQNGTVDLRTGKLRPHDRNDLITRISPAKFDAEAECPLWTAALQRIFVKDENPDAEPVPDQDLISFIQRLFGYSLTGDVEDEILPIFYGDGANGKTTLLSVILQMMGSDYAIAAPPNFLVVKHGEQHPTERALLHGKRLVTDMESAEGARLNEAFVKLVTGRDQIQCRGMRQDFWSFWPTHKIVMGTNHKPIIRETKDAIWRRVKLVPFNVTIPEADQDRKLTKKLRAEFPGILNWSIAGCLEWQKNGLAEPNVVKVATAEYRQDQDVMGDFLAEECTVNAQLWARAGALYTRYVKFTDRTGEAAMNLKAFSSALKDRGFERFINNGKCYRGLGLKPGVQADTDRSY